MIVYLHGFSSAPASHKAAQLKDALRDRAFRIADYPSHQPHAAIARLEALITRLGAGRRRSKLTLIGSSLGGFYARYLGDTQTSVARVVMINPALRPWQTLAPCVGRNTNFVSGEPFEFSRADLAALHDFRRVRLRRSIPTLVLLDAEDEVIDSRTAAEDYANCGKVVCYPGGSHRFEHLAEAIDEIRAFIE